MKGVEAPIGTISARIADMPNERGRYGHGWQRKRLIVLACLVPLVTFRPETLVFPVGVWLGKYFNPDQDAWNKLGDLEGLLLLDIYRKAVPHRGKASHTIGISGLILFAPVLLAIGITGWALGLNWWSATLWLTMGIIADNTLHITADKIESAYKKYVLGRRRLSGKRRKW